MNWCVEWNISPQSGMDNFHIDSVDNIAKKNRQMLEQGKVPTYFVIGHAPTIGEARQIANEYLTMHPRN